MFPRSDCAPYQNKFNLARKEGSSRLKMFTAPCGTNANIAIDNEVFRGDDQPEDDV
jgi:hypothetical protein